MRFLRHILNEATLSLWLAKRYWLDAAIGLGVMISMFAGIIYAVLSATGSSLSSGAVDGVIVGFVLYIFAVQAIGSAHGEIGAEMGQRTLEHVSVAPLSLVGLLVVRTFMSMSTAILLLAISLAVVEFITSGRMNIDYAEIVGVSALASVSLVGFGFGLAGVSVLSKQGGTLETLLMPLVLAIVAVPAYPLNAFSLLPFSLGASVARSVASGAHIDMTVLGLVALNSFLYFTVGFVFYRRMERHARRLGVLGHV